MPLTFGGFGQWRFMRGTNDPSRTSLSAGLQPTLRQTGAAIPKPEKISNLRIPDFGGNHYVTNLNGQVKLVAGKAVSVSLRWVHKYSRIQSSAQ